MRVPRERSLHARPRLTKRCGVWGLLVVVTVGVVAPWRVAAADTAAAFPFAVPLPESQILTVAGEAVAGGCSYSAPPWAAGVPGTVGVEREIALDPASCTYTVERGVVPAADAPAPAAASSPSVGQVPVGPCLGYCTYQQSTNGTTGGMAPFGGYPYVDTDFNRCVVADVSSASSYCPWTDPGTYSGVTAGQLVFASTAINNNWTWNGSQFCMIPGGSAVNYDGWQQGWTLNTPVSQSYSYTCSTGTAISNGVTFHAASPELSPECIGSTLSLTQTLTADTTYAGSEHVSAAITGAPLLCLETTYFVTYYYW